MNSTMGLKHKAFTEYDTLWIWRYFIKIHKNKKIFFWLICALLNIILFKYNFFSTLT